MEIDNIQKVQESKVKNNQQFIQEINRIFELQKGTHLQLAQTTYQERRAKLMRLQVAILETFKEEINEAAYKDFRKHPMEVQVSEIFPIISAIKYTSKHLRRWMRDQVVPTPISSFGFSSRIKYEPKGVVLIISPWNFAFNLSFLPLVSAIAAGNAVVLKPSENTPHSSKLIRKIVSSLFDESEVAVIEGGVPETTHLLTKAFNHIFFTGAPSIGKIVMKAAAKNLTSVSLELGGKSPSIVDQSADVEAAATRIAWSKSLNNGQVCIAPDYIYVHHSIKDKFIAAYKERINKMYGDNPQASDSYNRIVNRRHFERLKNYLEDARERGAQIDLGGVTNDEDNYISPTVVTELDESALLWQEEIFGPILPIRTFSNINEPIEYINSGEKPLALYIYSRNKKNIQNVENNTRAGGMVINYSATHYANPNLPFGGSNNSGIGKGNGYFGFQAFSNAKAVQRHWAPFDILKEFYPPYTKGKLKKFAFITKWLS